MVNSTIHHPFIKWHNKISNSSLGLIDALVKGILSDPQVIGARVLTTNLTTGAINSFVYWKKQIGTLSGPVRVEENDLVIGMKPDNGYPW